MNYPVLRIRDVYPGSQIRIFSNPDPGQKDPGTRIKGQKRIYVFLTQKIVCKLSEIWSGMFIPDQIPGPDLDFLPIPDQEVKKAPDPGSGFATLELLTCSGSTIRVCLREGGGVYYDRSEFIAGVQGKFHICYP